MSSPNPAGGSVLVRYFAGAAAAAGREEEPVAIAAPLPLDDLLGDLARRHGADLGRVLAASTFLLDTYAARRDDVVGPGSTLDVLPPFAGG